MQYREHDRRREMGNENCGGGELRGFHCVGSAYRLYHELDIVIKLNFYDI